MLNRFGSRGHTVPNLVVAQRVVNKMLATALHYGDDETGETLVGLHVPGGEHGSIDTLYILETISPDASAVRAEFTFHQGDEWQYEVFRWWSKNWDLYRQKRRASYGTAQQAKWDSPLRHLGDWHRQPGYMIQPSQGDLMTALDMLDDAENNFDSLLAPIVTLDHPPTTLHMEPGANFIALPQGDGLSARIDFWYIDRVAGVFLPITPAVYPDDQLPKLTPLPWHLANEDRFQAEMAQLHGDQLFTTLLLWNAAEQPPLSVCIMAARMGSSKVMIIITDWNYPETAPRARLAPFIPVGQDEEIIDIFEQMWAQSETVSNPPGWTWSPDRYLIDYICALEAAHGLKQHTHADDASAENGVES